MQLREVVKDTGLFGSGAANGNTNITTAGLVASSAQSTTDANPFKPPSSQQLQTGNGAAGIANPFQVGVGQQQQQMMNGNGMLGQQQQPGGWATDFGNAVFANGSVQHQQPQQQHVLQASMFGGSHGTGVFGSGYHHHHQGNAVMQQSNGFGMMQRNPFAVRVVSRRYICKF